MTADYKAPGVAKFRWFLIFSLRPLKAGTSGRQIQADQASQASEDVVQLFGSLQLM